MQRLLRIFASAAMVFGVALLGAGLSSPAGAASGGGFDQYGYNYTARVFNGTYWQWCQEQGYTSQTACAIALSGTDSNGNRIDPNIVNDQLIMKWNAAWDACNASYLLLNASGEPLYPNGNPTVCAGAWVNNEQNGMVPGGDGSVWLYKIVYSQACDNPTNGGYCVWGNYEVLMDQGTFDGVHTVNAVATPNGYGAFK